MFDFKYLQITFFMSLQLFFYNYYKKSLLYNNFHKIKLQTLCKNIGDDRYLNIHKNLL